MDKIRFYVPDFYSNFRLITVFHDLMEALPEYFYDNITIGAAYGCFPGSIWNGGRVMLGSCTKQEMEYVISELNRRDIAVRYTFTNPLIEKRHLLDTFCNLCMELGIGGKNEVLVNSPLLEEYIRNAFPDYPVISSTTKCIADFASICQELEKDYALVVLDSAMNNTEELFSLDHKDRIELIVNHYCMDNCPRRKEHYLCVGRSQLEFSEPDFAECDNINRDFYQIMKNRSFITAEAVLGKYKEAGFRNFKLDGRAFNKFKVLESFIYYFVKPEHREMVRHGILKKEFKAELR